MQNHLTSSSPQQGNSSDAARTAAEDWKRSFRLNTLDLNPQLQAAGDQPHWMTQEPLLARLLDRTRDEVVSLNAVLDAVGEPALPTDSNSLLAMLGLMNEPKPVTVTGKLRFAARVTAGLLRFHYHAGVARTQLHSASASPLTG